MNEAFRKGFLKAATASSRDITMNVRSMGASRRGSAFSAPSKPRRNQPKIDMGAKNISNPNTPMTTY